MAQGREIHKQIHVHLEVSSVREKASPAGRKVDISTRGSWKIKLESFSHFIYYTTFQLNKASKCKTRSYKSIKENIGELFPIILGSEIFLNPDSSRGTIKEEANGSGCIAAESIRTD